MTLRWGSQIWTSNPSENAQSIGDRRGEANALGNLGLAFRLLGNPRKAIELYELQIAATQTTGDRRAEGLAHTNMGLAYADLGDARRSIELHRESYLIARETGEQWAMAAALFNGALSLMQSGERKEAIQDAQKSLLIFEKIETPEANMVRPILMQWQNQFPEG